MNKEIIEGIKGKKEHIEAFIKYIEQKTTEKIIKEIEDIANESFDSLMPRSTFRKKFEKFKQKWRN